MKKIAQLRGRWSHRRTVSAPARTAPQLQPTSPAPLLIPPNLDSTLDVAKPNIRPHYFQGVGASDIDETPTTNALATPLPKDSTSDDAQDESDSDDQGFQDEINYLPIEDVFDAFDDRITDGLCTRCRGLPFVSSEQQLEVLRVGHIATVTRLSIRDGCELCVQFQDIFKAICESDSKTKERKEFRLWCHRLVEKDTRTQSGDLYFNIHVKNPVWTYVCFLRTARSLDVHHRSPKRSSQIDRIPSSFGPR